MICVVLRCFLLMVWWVFNVGRISVTNARDEISLIN
jgi:hypothetical protein